MSGLKNFATAAAGMTVVLGAYAFVQKDDERARLEDEARFGRGVLLTSCSNMTPNDPHYKVLGCEPE